MKQHALGFETTISSSKSKKTSEMSPISPYKEIFTLPQWVPTNQPQIHIASISKMNPTISALSSNMQRRVGDRKNYSTTTSSRIIPLAEEESSQNFIDMFTLTFSKLKNRNKYVQKVFFILGSQMGSKFIFFSLMIFEPRIMNSFRENWLPLFIVFTLLAQTFAIFMCTCSKLMRNSPNDTIMVFFSTLAVACQFAALTAYFNTTAIMMYITGCLTVVFLCGCILSSQERFDSTGPGMFLFFTIIAIVVSVGVIGLLTTMAVKEAVWEFMGVSLVVTLVYTILSLFLLKYIMHEGELNAGDYIYGALLLYLSFSTILLFKSLIVCLKGGKGSDGRTSMVSVASSEITMT